jgi:pimeloyl-ACP methyl ester carboxylesterase
MARSEGSGEPLLTAAERDYYASAYAQTGFTGPINWYRNWTLNWETQADFGERITVPTLFIGAADDVVVAPEHIEAMKPLVEDLEVHMLEDCGHWSQQEEPDEVNRLMIDWLKRKPA